MRERKPAKLKDETVNEWLDGGNISTQARASNLLSLDREDLRDQIRSGAIADSSGVVFVADRANVSRARTIFHTVAKEIILSTGGRSQVTVVNLSRHITSLMRSVRDGEEEDFVDHLFIASFCEGGVCPLTPAQIQAVRDDMWQRWESGKHTSILVDGDTDSMKQWYGTVFTNWLADEFAEVKLP